IKQSFGSRSVETIESADNVSSALFQN
ncbi:hypothetical protein RSAG8_00479, partial [Rhizoctonia solani AG-8 WAC10335]